MTAHGYELAWPPTSPGSPEPVAQKPALAFDFFECRGFGAKRLDGRPYGKDGGLCQSVFNRPDARVTSAVFNRSAYFDALCHPWHCPESGCGDGLRPLLVLTASEPGSGRVQVVSVEQRSGSCPGQSADSSRVLGSATYKILEGRLFNETARPAGDNKPKLCPSRTCPRKIFVPPVTAPWVWTGIYPNGTSSYGGVTPGPRENVCVPACDGGGKANATAKAVEYASAPLDPLASPCPTQVYPNIHFACKPACLSWLERCCALDSIPGPSADCPACPPGTRIDAGKPTATVRLRLASIVAPNANAPCANFTRMADEAIVRAGETIPPYPKEHFLIYGRKLLAGCPPRELALAITAGCDITLSSPSGLCPAIKTAPAGGQQSSTTLLDPERDRAAAMARRVKEDVTTRLWSVLPNEGNMTVLAIEPDGPGGRGLVALKVQPVGCILRYAVVEGSFLGASAPIAATAGAQLPPASRWCPGGTTKAAEPAVLAEPGEPVPVCVMKQ